MAFEKGKEPDHFASYLSDKADQEKRDELAKKGKKLSREQRAKLAKDRKFTDKRNKFEQN